jgi:hypothetical protein
MKLLVILQVPWLLGTASHFFGTRKKKQKGTIHIKK